MYADPHHNTFMATHIRLCQNSSALYNTHTNTHIVSKISDLHMDHFRRTWVFFNILCQDLTSEPEHDYTHTEKKHPHSRVLWSHTGTHTHKLYLFVAEIFSFSNIKFDFLINTSTQSCLKLMHFKLTILIWCY